MTRRFWTGAAFTLPLIVLAFESLIPLTLVPSARRLLELALATPVCVWAAWPFYTRAVRSVRLRSLNMFTLIGLGVGVAYLYSVVAAPPIARWSSGDPPGDSMGGPLVPFSRRGCAAWTPEGATRWRASQEPSTGGPDYVLVMDTSQSLGAEQAIL